MRSKLFVNGRFHPDETPLTTEPGRVYLISRTYYEYKDEKYYEPKVHPKHAKSPLIPQSTDNGKVNRSKSKRKRKK